MDQGVVDQIIAVFATPLGAWVLKASFLTIVVVLAWAFWRRNERPTRYQVEDVPAPVTPPPLLAPEMFTGSGTAVPPQDNTLRNILIFLLALMVIIAVFGLSQRRGPVGEDRTVVEVGAPDRAALPTDIPPIPAYVPPPSDRIVCDEGFVDPYLDQSYLLCAQRQAALFERLDLVRQGQPLVNPRWGQDLAPIVTADNQPAPFTLDETVSVSPGTGAALEDYDAFLAIGMVSEPLERSTATRVSAARGFHMGQFILDHLRGEVEADCRSNATVYALSVGKYDYEGAYFETVEPVLIGIKFDEGFPIGDRDLDSLIEDFMRSQGVTVSGYNLRRFEPHQILFDEPACRIL